MSSVTHLYNIFLERLMSDALEEHEGKVSIGGRNTTNMRFANDIVALDEEKQELEALVESFDKTCTRYKTEINAEKTKRVTNSTNDIQPESKIKWQKLGTVISSKYLGAIVSDGGFVADSFVLCSVLFSFYIFFILTLLFFLLFNLVNLTELPPVWERAANSAYHLLFRCLLRYVC